MSQPTRNAAVPDKLSPILSPPAPILVAYADAHGCLCVWCAYCRRWHFHGRGAGHRVAHCKPGGPYERSGYILCPLEEWQGGDGAVKAEAMPYKLTFFRCPACGGHVHLEPPDEDIPARRWCCLDCGAIGVDYLGARPWMRPGDGRREAACRGN